MAVAVEDATDVGRRCPAPSGLWDLGVRGADGGADAEVVEGGAELGDFSSPESSTEEVEGLGSRTPSAERKDGFGGGRIEGTAPGPK